MAEDLATQNKKRPRQMLSPDHESQQNEMNKKRPKVKRNDSTSSVDLCQRLSNAIENILIVTKNEEFRQNCFQLLGVENGSDAGVKIKELAMKLKGKKQQQKKGGTDG